MQQCEPVSFRDTAVDLPRGVTLRNEVEHDLPFLRTLYASTRSEELAPLPWSEAQKRAFLEQQFELQRAQYRQHYVGAEWLVIERQGAPIGRLYLKRSAAELRLMDIALLPQERGRGLGTELTTQLLRWADAQGVPVTLHVEPFNPAYRLYRRFGFAYARSTGIYHFLERPVVAAPDAAYSPLLFQLNTIS